MIYYIADTHFGHANAIPLNNRPFNNVDEMDAYMISQWNDRVTNEDIVYIIGDFCYRDKRGYYYYLNALNGQLNLIIGNHDVKFLSGSKFTERFNSIEKMMHVNDCGRHICCCHFPLAEWNGYYRNNWHIYGHVHNSLSDTAKFMIGRDRALNAGVDINGFKPVTFDELILNNEVFKRRGCDSTMNYMKETSLELQKIIQENERCSISMNVELGDVRHLTAIGSDAEFRYTLLNDMVIVSRVLFNNRNNGCLTKCMKVLGEVGKKYNIRKIIIQSVETVEMAKWCEKNEYKANGVSILSGIPIDDSKYFYGDYEHTIQRLE